MELMSYKKLKEYAKEYIVNKRWTVPIYFWETYILIKHNKLHYIN